MVKITSIGEYIWTISNPFCFSAPSSVFSHLCSFLVSAETYQLNVVYGKTYLLRIINAAMNEMLYFAIANHKLTVVGTDASYTKPLARDFITIGPGQTYDCLLQADQYLDQSYFYMAASPYVSGTSIDFDNTTTTARVKYIGRTSAGNCSRPSLPYLPRYKDTTPAINFTGSIRSLASKEHPIDVPLKVKTHLLTTIAVNTLPCPSQSNVSSTCEGPNGTRFAASMNNISFIRPLSVDILEAYYYSIKGVYRKNFPKFPPYVFNYTAEYQPLTLLEPKRATEVRILPYGTAVEMVIQGTSLVVSIDHPMHLHGFSFYVVGQGLGNFNKKSDPKNYNLVDPPKRNTIPVPKDGWVAIRFAAKNPGITFFSTLYTYIYIHIHTYIFLMKYLRICRSLVHALPSRASSFMGYGYSVHCERWAKTRRAGSATPTRYATMLLLMIMLSEELLLKFFSGYVL